MRAALRLCDHLRRSVFCIWEAMVFSSGRKCFTWAPSNEMVQHRTAPEFCRGQNVQHVTLESRLGRFGTEEVAGRGPMGTGLCTGDGDRGGYDKGT